jgi:glycosyltransferase involved in cell wall biosynthesis
VPDPLVSVKMITYNHAPYIARAIEGVLMQKTNFPFELVIGEDCSTDGTREIVFDYKNKYSDIIQVITSGENVGAKKNSYRNTKACRGKYLAFCEGDDYWHHPDKLQKQVDYLENHLECGLVYSSYDVYHVKSEKRIKDFIKYKGREIAENARISDIVDGKGGILTCTVIVRRALYEDIIESDPYLHQSDQFLMGDTQIWAEVANLSHLHFIPESLATHIITDESATRSNDIKKKLKFRISNAELLLYLCKKYNFSATIINKHQDNWCGYSLELAFHSRNGDLAEIIRKRKRTFSWKEYFRYYGAKYKYAYFVYQVALLFRNIFRKENDEWE